MWKGCGSEGWPDKSPWAGENGDGGMDGPGAIAGEKRGGDWVLGKEGGFARRRGDSDGEGQTLQGR